MKVVKPQRLSLLCRVVQHQRQNIFVVSVLGYVPLDAPRHLLPEANLWQDAADAIPGGLLDEGHPKPDGEVLVSGAAYAIGGSATGVPVRLAVERGGDTLVDKRLAVVGDRWWKGSSPTRPATFERMPVDWHHAFGGAKFPQNPHGKGIDPVESEHGPVVPLPNVEDPRRALAGPRDRPPPAGFGAYEMAWPQRFAKVGKDYGQKWLEELYPGPAADFDATFYNVAPADQRLDGFFGGDERLVIEGMHPEKKTLECRLEPLVVRVFVTQRLADGQERFVELGTRLDTLHVLPDRERLVLIHRGTMAVAEDDADDVVHLIVAAEHPEHPKPVEHYREVLALRLDKDKGALAAMRDADLLPPATAGFHPRPDLGDIGEMTRLELRALKNAERGRHKRMAETRAALEEAGFDVGDAFDEPQLPAVPDPYDPDALMTMVDDMQRRAAELTAEAEQKKLEIETEKAKAFAEAGFDDSAETGGPPEFSADEHLVMLHDMARISAEGGTPLVELERDLSDPRYAQMLAELEERVRGAYVMYAHVMPAAALPAGDAASRLRARLVAAKEAGESMAGKNLVGADLHGLDLGGLDLRGTFLERADLSGADLQGADLSGAVLARADLRETNLSGANLSGANLGDCRLTNTNLSGSRLDDAVLMRSILDGALLVGARMGGTDFIEVTFEGADFSHAELLAPLFLQADMRQTCFTGASLEAARFLQVDLRGVDFTAARMPRAQLIAVKGDGAVFAGADLCGAVFVHESSFCDSVFIGAALTGANFRKTPLSRADFTEARLDNADLSGCDLRLARLGRVRAHHARMVRSNLAGADLRGADLLGAFVSKALLFGTDLRGCNLSRGDVSLSQSDGDTRLDDALMLDTRVDPRYRPPPEVESDGT